VIVQHRADRPDVLTELLQWRTALKVVDATAGLRPKAGSVYIAEPGQQLTLDPDGCFVYGEPHGRCLVDPLLATAAKVHAERLVAVILTGRLDDGAEGVIAVKAAGGRVFAQDRGSAAAFSMPSAATATGCVDFVLPPPAIASALITLAMLPAAAALFSVQPPPWALSA
jgi:two-component system chemotaxis response regulator CheB